MELGDVIVRLEAVVNHLVTTKVTKASDILIVNFVPIISFDAQQRPLLSRLLKKIRNASSASA